MNQSSDDAKTGVQILEPKTHILVVALWINFGFNLGAAIVSGIQWFIVDSLHAGVVISSGTVRIIDAFAGNDFYAQIGLSILTAFIFLSWMSQAYSNLAELKVADRKYSTGRAVGGWFIPFANLVIPYGVMKEIWKGSSPAAYNPKNSHAWKKVTDYAPVREWWLGWVFFIILAYSRGWVLLPGTAGRIAGSAFSYLLLAIVATLAIRVVKGVQRRQSTRLEAIRDAELAERIEREIAAI